MGITAADVKALREKTGVGMMECKKALVETNGDMEKAVDVLRERGLAMAVKKSSRTTADGVVTTYSQDGFTAVLEVNSETDFVANNEDFKSFVTNVARTILKEKPKDVEDLLTKKFIDSDNTVNDELQSKILVIKENIKIRRFVILEGIVSTYIHGGGTVAVAVKFDTDAETAKKSEFAVMGKDVAMQIAAMSPSYLDAESVPADVVEHEKEILMAQMNEDPVMSKKPQAVKEKIIPGKISKYYDENCLLRQAFVKDGDITVGQYIDNTAKDLGASVKVVDFVRYAKGEGIEKRQDDFADEVKNMMG